MEEKKKLWLIIGIVAAVLLIAALVGFWIYNNQPNNPPAKPTEPGTTQGTEDGTQDAGDGEEAPETGVPFTVIVVHADGSEKTFQYRSEEQYVGTVLLAEGLVSGDQGDYGLYIKAVDGEKADYNEDGAYWGFFIGDEYAMTGVDKTPIEEGKVYKLVYTKG